MLILVVFLSIFLINIVFGYWRSNTRRFSPQWIIAIHIPVPIAIALRLALLGWNWLELPLFVLAFFLGQYSGSKIRVLLKQRSVSTSSFLITDLGKVLVTWQKRKV